ncbi:MAG TPA: hypothetical protein VGF70_07210 [Solirubrobacteraceae bacterium]|jgi:hypothetical protein
MSDSLKASVIVIELVLTISANGVAEAEEEEEEALEPPRLPAVVPLVVPVEELDEDPPLDVEDPEALEVEPADTVSPGERPDSDTIVPLIGADSVVSASAVLALLTFAWALYTAACAEAMVAGEGVVVVEPPVLDPLDPPAADGAVAGLLGVVVAVGLVVVGAGVVLVEVVWRWVVVVGVVLVVVVGMVLVVVVFVVVVGTVFVSDTNSVVAGLEAALRLVAVAPAGLGVDVEPDSAALS